MGHINKSKSILIHWIAFYVNNKNMVYFSSFDVKHILKEITKIIGNKNIITNIYRIQACDQIKCRYFYIGLNNFMLKGQSLLDDTNLFFPNKYDKNDIQK